MYLQRVMALIKMELKKLIREPAYLFLMLLFPAVLTFTFGISFPSSAPNIGLIMGMGMDFNSMVPGLFTYACIFIIMTVGMSFCNDRQEGMLKRLNTTPMTSSEFMGSHVASKMITSILQVVIIFGIAVLLGFRPLTDISGILLAFGIMALFSLSSIGLGLITATISKSPEAATGISFVFILPQMFFGTFVPLNTNTQIMAMGLPSHYATDALTSIFGGTPLLSANILVDFTFVSIVSIVIVLLGIHLFNKYGNA